MNAQLSLLLGGLPVGQCGTIHGLAGTADVINAMLFGAEVDSQGNVSQKKLSQSLLGTADAVLYCPQAGNTAAISQIVLVNTSGVAVSGVKIGVDGTAATAANQLISSLTIPANGQAVFINGSLKVFDSGGNVQVAGAANTAFDATIPAITTPLALGAVGSAATAPHRDHTHQSPGGIASIVAASAGIVNVETQVVGATIPAALLRVGTVLRFRAFAFITSTVNNDLTFNIRLGPTTLTGNIPAALTCKPGNGGTVTAAGVIMEILLTIRTIGANGTMYASGFAMSLSSGAAVTQALALANELFVPASVAVDTTVANVAELTCVTAATTSAVTFQSGVIEVVRM